MGPSTSKDWNEYVVAAEAVARNPGFQELRDLILERAALQTTDVVLDLGAGTGLLSLEAAKRAERIWALDISPRMCDYLVTKGRSAGLDNIESVVASIVSVPLVDETVDVVVSNYCFHHVSGPGKLAALREVRRILRPGGRFVMGDMMFSPALSDPRSREVAKRKARAMLTMGLPGAWRLTKNLGRYVAGRWEQPATPEWWREALREVGFEDIDVRALHHEGGVAYACKPGEVGT
jgi:ubiquinone/menaquinone biosynthesis C-methylase UbiE